MSVSGVDSIIGEKPLKMQRIVREEPKTQKKFQPIEKNFLSPTFDPSMPAFTELNLISYRLFLLFCKDSYIYLTRGHLLYNCLLGVIIDNKFNTY